MDTSTEEALKAIITGIKASERSDLSLTDAISQSLSVSALVCKEAHDPATAEELYRLANWAKHTGN